MRDRWDRKKHLDNKSEKKKKKKDAFPTMCEEIVFMNSSVQNSKNKKMQMDKRLWGQRRYTEVYFLIPNQQMSKLNRRGSTSKPAELMSLWCNLCQKCIVQLSVSWHLGWVGGEGVLTCIQTMLRTTSRFREKGVSQRGLWWNILVNGSVTQVFHNSMHKIGSGTVSAKVSCPYLEFAQTHKCIHTQTDGNGVQGGGGN